MNIILFNEQDYQDQEHICLRDYRFAYIHKVHQPKIGDFLRVGKLNGLMGMAEVKELTSRCVTLRPHLDQSPPAPLPLTLIIGLPRPKSMRRVLLPAVNMGVKHIVFINCFRVEKSFWSSDHLLPQNLQPILQEGLELARDTIVPSIEFKRRFKPYIEDELTSLVQGQRALVAHPYPTPQPALISDSNPIPRFLAVGPEGGFIEYEINKFIDIGFSGLEFGQRILKLEHAIPALLAKIFY